MKIVSGSGDVSFVWGFLLPGSNDYSWREEGRGIYTLSPLGVPSGDRYIDGMWGSQ